MKAFKILIFSFLTYSCWAQKPPVTVAANKPEAKPAYGINIKIKGISNDSCSIGYYMGQMKYTPVQKVKADELGNLKFTGTEPLKCGVYLCLLPKSYFEFVVTKESQFFSLATDTAELVQNMKITNSPPNTLFYDFQKYVNVRAKRLQNEKNRDIIDSLSNEITKKKESLIKNNPTSFVAHVLRATDEVKINTIYKKDGKTVDTVATSRLYKEHYFDNIDFCDECLIRSPVFVPKFEKYFDEWVYQDPDSLIKDVNKVIKKAECNKEMYRYVVGYLSNKYETSKTMGQDAVFVDIAFRNYCDPAKKYWRKDFGKDTLKTWWVDTATINKICGRARILDNVLLGKVAPNMFLQDSLGNYMPLHTLKSKYLILCFWDSDCGHCQKEVPKLFEFYNKYKDSGKGIGVVAVNIERKDEGWKKFIRTHNLKGPAWFNLRDRGNHTNFHDTYDIYATPVIYILDENKKIIAKRLGLEQLEDFFVNYTKIRK